MLARTHALSGAAVWLTVAPHGRPTATAAGALVCAGAACLPDIDHPKAVATTFLGPVSRIPAALVQQVSNGHRGRTHTLPAVALAATLTYLAPPWLTLFLLAALGLRALIHRWIAIPLIAALMIAIPVAHPASGWWLIVAVALGYAAHLVGDMLTDGGVPLGWPITPRRMALPVLGRTGGLGEGLAAVGLVVVAIIAI